MTRWARPAAPLLPAPALRREQGDVDGAGSVGVAGLMSVAELEEQLAEGVGGLLEAVAGEPDAQIAAARLEEVVEGARGDAGISGSGASRRCRSRRPWGWVASFDLCSEAVVGSSTDSPTARESISRRPRPALVDPGREQDPGGGEDVFLPVGWAAADHLDQAGVVGELQTPADLVLADARRRRRSRPSRPARCRRRRRRRRTRACRRRRRWRARHRRP